MNKYIESEKLDLKAKFTDTITRDIVAFLNADGGDIVVGVTNDGKAIGVNDVDETSKNISDVITMQIEPNPQSIITSELIYDDDKTLIVIHVQKGLRPIYCIKKYGFSASGCLIRIGTTCKEMTPEQIHVRYEENFTDTDLMLKTPAKYASVSFKTLKVYYSDKGYHLDDASFEANLNLRTDDGKYNVLAELMSDRNMVPLILVKFNGKDKSSVSEKYDYGSRNLLFAYEQMKNRIISENICISNTTVRPREDKFLFDFDSVNEALINALVHNDWNISQPLVSIFSDRIEIFSHGGLPKGQTRELFLRGISKPRNDMLMRIFLSMNLVEHTGHGIPTIISKYGESVFDVGDSFICVSIPFDKNVVASIEERKNVGINVGINVGLNKTEKQVISKLLICSDETADEIAQELGVTKRTIERALKSLQEKGTIIRSGSKKTGQWIVLK